MEQYQSTANDFNRCSTSGIMSIVFRDDVQIIRPLYSEIIESLAHENPSFYCIFEQCKNRTGFIWPYLAVEYGYFSCLGETLPNFLKKLATSYALISLSIAIDDDIIDEVGTSISQKMKMICVSSLLKHEAYHKLTGDIDFQEKELVTQKIREFLVTVTEYQYRDILFITQQCRDEFVLEDYLDLTYKTGCIFEKGLTLGMEIAGSSDFAREGAILISKALGCTLQLIDDILDLEDDLSNFGELSVTFPMHVYYKEGTLDKVYLLIDEQLHKARSYLDRLRYPAKLESVIDGLKKVSEMIKTENSHIGIRGQASI